MAVWVVSPHPFHTEMLFWHRFFSVCASDPIEPGYVALWPEKVRQHVSMQIRMNVAKPAFRMRVWTWLDDYKDK